MKRSLGFLAGAAAVLFSMNVSHASEARSHQIDFRDYQGSFTRVYRDRPGAAPQAQQVILSLSYDSSGYQVLSYKWQGAGGPYTSTLTADPAKGLFKSDAVLAFGGECNSLTDNRSRIEAKKVSYRCAIYTAGKAPYSGVEIAALSPDSFSLTYTQSRCLWDLGGHIGCMIYGRMETTYSETFVRAH